MQLTKDEIDALWDSTAEVGSDIGGHHRFAAAVIATNTAKVLEDVEPVAWGLFDSQGFYDTRDTEAVAKAFCENYNSMVIDPLKPYTYEPIYPAHTVAALKSRADALAARVAEMGKALTAAIEAMESCEEGDYSTGHVCHPSFDVGAIDAAIERARAATKAIQANPQLENERDAARYRSLRNHRGMDHDSFAVYSTLTDELLWGTDLDREIDRIAAHTAKGQA